MYGTALFARVIWIFYAIFILWLRRRYSQIDISIATSGKKMGDLWNWFILSVIKERLFKINLLMEHPSALAEAGVDWDETFDGEPWNGSAVMKWTRNINVAIWNSSLH